MKPITALAAALTLALSACAPQPKSTPRFQTPPKPPGTATPLPPPVPSNWMDAPQTPGDWNYRKEGGHSFAEFSGIARDRLFQISCTAERDMRMSVARRGSSSQSLRIMAETTTRSLAAVSSDGWVTSRIPANDRLLDAMALSKGRFAVELAGAPTLYLPSWAEVTRVIEDCR